MDSVHDMDAYLDIDCVTVTDYGLFVGFIFLFREKDRMTPWEVSFFLVRFLKNSNFPVRTWSKLKLGAKCDEN